MAVCPRCKAELQQPTRPCPMCGILSVPPPAMVAMPAAPELHLDVPDLEIPGAPSARVVETAAASRRGREAQAAEAPRISAVPPVQHGGAPSSFDEDDDIFAQGGGGGAIELDMGPGHAAPRVSSPAQPLAMADGASSRASAPRASHPGPMRTSSPPGARDGLAPARRGPDNTIDPYDARVLADYGDPPEKWWLTPLYAFRVLTRRSELRRLLANARHDATRAETRSDDVLVAFAERARGLVEKNPAHARALDEVLATEAVLRSRDGALAGEMDAHRAQLTAVDARMSEIEGELLSVQAEERRIADELAQLAAVRERADAKMKRAEIEIRNATELLESKRTSGTEGAASSRAQNQQAPRKG